MQRDLMRTYAAGYWQSLRYLRELPAQEFDKEGHVRQAAIVENKLLSLALEHAKNLQDQRDEAKLRSAHVTKRDKRLLRERRARAAAS